MMMKKNSARKPRRDAAIAHWKNRVVDLKAKHVLMRAALKVADVFVADMVHLYAPEQCSEESVAETQQRIADAQRRHEEKGTLGYYGEVARQIREALKS